MTAREALHAALDMALSDAFTGHRQNALSIILAQVRECFSPGEFRAALRQVWPDPLTYKSIAQEEIEERMSAALDHYHATGEPHALAEWTARYLAGARFQPSPESVVKAKR